MNLHVNSLTFTTEKLGDFGLMRHPRANPFSRRKDFSLQFRR